MSPESSNGNQPEDNKQDGSQQREYTVEQTAAALGLTADIIRGCIERARKGLPPQWPGYFSISPNGQNQPVPDTEPNSQN